MVEKIKEILKALQERWPTDIQRHGFCYDTEKDLLELTIFHDGLWWTFYPEGDDLENVEYVVSEIAKWLT